MRRILLSSVLALSASAALAADLPAKKAPVAPVPMAIAYNWTGFYAGVHAGYTWSANDLTLNGPVAGALGLPTKLSSSPAGFIGGVQAGYNHQIGQFVVGVEADAGFTSGTDRSAHQGVNGGVLNVTSKGAMLSTVRARAGVAFDRVLLFTTGGFAFSNSKAEGTVTVPNGLGLNAGTFTGKADGNRQGWALGGGVEYAVTNNITAKAEYLYTSLGDKNFQYDVDNTAKVKFDANLVRAGLNYKF